MQPLENALGKRNIFLLRAQVVEYLLAHFEESAGGRHIILRNAPLRVLRLW